MSSWKKSALSAASSRLSSFKGYIAQQDLRNSLPDAISRQIGAGKERAGNFKEWAGQKMNKGYNNGQTNTGTEKISLFPGWAARRYPTSGQREDSFEIEVYVSGFASTHRSADATSRSQRAFLRLAKGFAALPKLESNDNDSATTSTSGVLPEPRTLSRSTEDLLKSVRLPPKPEDISEDYEAELLEREFQSLSGKSEDLESLNSNTHSQPSSRANSVYDLTLHEPSPEPSLGTIVKSTAADELRKLHTNLESRLQPFWSSAIPNRTVRLRLYTSPHHISDPSNPSVNTDNGPVSIQDVVTGPDGSFQARFIVGWTDLANHSGAEHIAFGDPSEEHELLVSAELIPLPSPISSVASSAASSTTDFALSSRSSNSSSRNTTKAYLPTYPSQYTPLSLIPPTNLCIPLTYSPVRVISDIDDTIKYSNVTGGARAVFHNVFVRELKDLVIPGMGEWYEEMWTKGVRFHYVSNGPFELLPLIGEFFQISKLPPGSIKLRSYAGRSLFSGLLSAPSARKRAGVLEILDAFPDSRFILIGDSGEQDLELYTELARERTEQVLAIFIRDTGEGEALSDPTGDSYDRMPSRSAPTSFDTPAPAVPGDSNVNSSRPPSRSLTPLSISASYASRSRKAPVSGGPRSSTDYFNTKPLTAEPDPLVDFSDSPLSTTVQSVQPTHPFPPGSFTPITPITPRTPAIPATPVTGSTSVTPRTPKTPWTNHSNASYASFKSKRSVGSTSTVGNSVARMTESEKKQYELQMRVNRARGSLPFRTALRVFRSPEECLETWELLDT
ncbi:hypothetical protein GGU10DRAFT_428524 [Lentinula aff. detonsa]|uniref:Phosphatidate phosphatase APP1 catalytic domain-containing protein n=1 Tax=Lentinula aff. detonsa TaxID=2804958 RepID=A0AA38L4Z6_9AGAR|nr:hypothetical protein GGU10DRAFT_428524 [Lentinula aff. detonsa]